MEPDISNFTAGTGKSPVAGEKRADVGVEEPPIQVTVNVSVTFNERPKRDPTRRGDTEK
jgi:hypothetical protein